MSSEELLQQLLDSKKKSRPRLGSVKVDSSDVNPKQAATASNALKEYSKHLKCMLSISRYKIHLGKLEYKTMTTLISSYFNDVLL